MTSNGKVKKRKSTVTQEECKVLLQCVCFHMFYMFGSAQIKHFLKFNCYCTFSKYAGILDYFLSALTDGSIVQTATYFKWTLRGEIQ